MTMLNNLKIKCMETTVFGQQYLKKVEQMVDSRKEIRMEKCADSVGHLFVNFLVADTSHLLPSIRVPILFRITRVKCTLLIFTDPSS